MDKTTIYATFLFGSILGMIAGAFIASMFNEVKNKLSVGIAFVFLGYFVTIFFLHLDTFINIRPMREKEGFISYVFSHPPIAQAFIFAFFLGICMLCLVALILPIDRLQRINLWGGELEFTPKQQEVLQQTNAQLQKEEIKADAYTAFFSEKFKEEIRLHTSSTNFQAYTSLKAMTEFIEIVARSKDVELISVVYDVAMLKSEKTRENISSLPSKLQAGIFQLLRDGSDAFTWNKGESVVAVSVEFNEKDYIIGLCCPEGRTRI
jgi:hypothetical protein